jgi:hypothetical protein
MCKSFCWLMNRALCMNYFITPTSALDTKQLITSQLATGTIPTLLRLPIGHHVTIQSDNKIRTLIDTVNLARLMTYSLMMTLLCRNMYECFRCFKGFNVLKSCKTQNSWLPHNTQPEPFQRYSDYRYATT